MDYCADHDPLLLAPEFTCNGCDAGSTPVNADWITETQILATYTQEHEQSCQRSFDGSDTWTVLVDLTLGGGFAHPPADNAWRARDHYHTQATGYPLGTQFCGVCRVALERGAWWCDEHRCRATAKSTGRRCGAKGTNEGYCGSHRSQAVR